MNKTEEKKESKPLNSFEGKVHDVCVHTVSFRYWDFEAELTDELKELLTEEAEDRARACIIEGYWSGDLNCLYVDDDGEEEEITGWWEIDD